MGNIPMPSNIAIVRDEGHGPVDVVWCNSRFIAQAPRGAPVPVRHMPSAAVPGIESEFPQEIAIKHN